MKTKEMHLLGLTFFLIIILTLNGTAVESVEFPSSNTIWNIQLRVLAGTRTEGGEPSKFVTASYPSLKYLRSVNLLTDRDDAADESAKLKKIFNLSDIRLLTETVLSWKETESDGASHSFRLDGREFMIRLTRKPGKPGSAFRIVVIESPRDAPAAGKMESGNQKTGDSGLLETEFNFPQEKSVVIFGFEDNGGNPYFISLRQSGGKADGPDKPIRAIGSIPAPKLVKMVNPVYPDEAKKLGIEGTVILECTADEKGQIVATRILRSVPQLDQAAVDAVRQWVYEPIVINGKPSKIIFTATVRFDLRDKDGKGGKTLESQKGAVRAKGDVVPPKLIEMVEPVYPDEARKKGIEGTVILECTVDEKGKVVDARILRSIPGLDQAAVDAVKKWTYEPMVINGKPSKIIFTATVCFRLKDDDVLEKKIREFDKDAVRAEGEIMPPRLVKQVDPVYPEAARDAKIQGTVILGVKTDEEGRIIDVLVLKSIPGLDEAAIDAVRQWRYEPLVIKGKPKKVTFTVTVRFQLKS